ncbi:conserved Plasmodium protein, unknown function [Plasmodium knowlesi strain H]|uniref:Uncharacterized protein n=3 Tax=Plasmodium knowlesi TaxID=5850 RepID=A0A5K1V1P4_PLAKH|nr:conserved Plasmodium protein, unknown function [Plasmodium knowlesi strain H]OTN64352.1 Uncharacterized protein PKNOH_S130178400 [Plasmodium knowlesi]CAA9988952.1 conserved Plasmodium protein, unknown function [Plasmodium knowlesi strain H]SBO24796.1 conserved Plasmodium protein, unknown function [Plasmodium knowlesi strain H]SBO28059.1 conserved Plasmodium protein, unknown function [Plasmodium knowlesi strain H]VVS78426.1 conserved Plasmodium protein, unknown function [Plasmodium knowlesi |eukprot:XP_002261300.1 hypothetical protein, conserved in Plasmodium species [Plasmodium knowlesi strain H]
MLSKQLNDLRVQKQVQVFEDKNIDKLTRNKYSLFRNVYKNVIVSPAHAESIKSCLRKLAGINKSFGAFEKLFYLEESDVLHSFYDAQEVEKNIIGEEYPNGYRENYKTDTSVDTHVDDQIYRKHREFLTQEEEIVILKKVKSFLKLCSIYANRKHVKILIEFLIYKYEINVKCSEDILMCILPNLSLPHMRNILEIIYIEKSSAFFFINNYKHEDLKNVDQSVFVHHIKRNISIYKIMFEYVVELIYSNDLATGDSSARSDDAISGEMSNRVSIPYVNFFISVTEDIIHSYIDMPVEIIEFYCNVLLVLFRKCEKSFEVMKCAHRKGGKDDSVTRHMAHSVATLQIHYCVDFLEKFLKTFEDAIGKCKTEFNFEFLKNKIFSFFETGFLSTWEEEATPMGGGEEGIASEVSSPHSRFMNSLLVLLNVIYKNAHQISFASFLKEEQVRTGATPQQERITSEHQMDEKVIQGIINFVKENKKNCFDRNINAIIQDHRALRNLLSLLYKLNGTYEVTDNLIKIVLIKSYSLRLNWFPLEDIFLQTLKSKKNYVFNIIVIVNFISFYIFLIKSRENEMDEGISDASKLKKNVEPLRTKKVVEAFLGKVSHGNSLHPEIVIQSEHLYHIVKFFLKENNDLFRKKIILFELYSKIDERLLRLIKGVNTKLQRLQIFNALGNEKEDFNNPEVVERAIRSVKYMYDHRRGSEASGKASVDEPTDCTNGEPSEEASFSLGTIKKGKNFSKSKRNIECLYGKIFYQLRQNKIQLVDYMKKYEKELIYFFPSKKYLYRIMFDAFNELKHRNFCEIDNERNTTFLKFYLKLFLVKLTKLEIKNKIKLQNEKFFKKFVNVNFAFFFILYDYLQNKNLYPNNSFFSRNILSGSYKLVEDFLKLLTRVKGLVVEAYTFEEFFQAEMKDRRCENIKGVIKHSMPFRPLILCRIVRYLSEEMENSIGEYTVGNMIEGGEEKVCPVEGNSPPGEDLKRFFRIILKCVFRYLEDVSSIKEKSGSHIYGNIEESFQKTILKFRRINSSVTFYLYCKYLNTFFLSDSCIQFVHKTLDLFFCIFKMEKTKKHIKNKNMLKTIIAELFRLRNRLYKNLNVKSFYQTFLLSFIVAILPDISNPYRHVSVLYDAKRYSKNTPHLVDYFVINKLFEREKGKKCQGFFHLLEDNQKEGGFPHVQHNGEESTSNRGNQTNQIISSPLNEYTVNYTFASRRGKYKPTMNDEGYEKRKYYLFIFAYLSRPFFDTFLSNFHNIQLKKFLYGYFLKEDLILPFLRKIMERNSYPYKITKIYEVILGSKYDLSLKRRQLFLLLHLVDFYVNALENATVKGGRRGARQKGGEIPTERSVPKRNGTTGDQTIRTNHLTDENSSATKTTASAYVPAKFLKKTNSQKFQMKGNSDLQTLNMKKKIKKIKYKNIVNEPGGQEADKAFFQNLKGFFKYHENLFTNSYFKKEVEIKAICQYIIQHVLNFKDKSLTIQLFCIKNFATSCLFSKDLQSSIEKLEVANLMLCRKLFAKKEHYDYQPILLMCKNVSSVKERNKILLFMEEQMIQVGREEGPSASHMTILKIITALSDGGEGDRSASESGEEPVEDYTHIQFVETHIRIFRKIAQYAQINDILFLKLLKYLSNICSLIYEVPELVSQHFSLTGNNFLFDVVSFFETNIFYLREDVTAHLKPLAHILDKTIKRKIWLFVQAKKSASSPVEGERTGDILANTDTHEGSHSRNHNAEGADPRGDALPNLTLPQNESTNGYGEQDIAEAELEEESSNKKEHNRSASPTRRVPTLEMSVSEDMDRHYHLHTFAYMCTFINRIFKNEINLEHFTVIVNNLIFLFNKKYTSYVIAICFVNIIIKIKLEKLHACKNYLLEICYAYFTSDLDYCINNHLLLLLGLYLCPHNPDKDELLEGDSPAKTTDLQHQYEDLSAIYPEYVLSKLKYFKPHLKKVKNNQNLCLKIISLISIVNTLNRNVIKSISYFIYILTLQNFVLCFCFARDKVINRKLNILFRKFSFRNTDTFVWAYVLNNFKMEGTSKERTAIVEKSSNDTNHRGHQFEELFLLKFLQNVNKLKDHMKFEEGYKKLLRCREKLNNQRSDANNSAIKSEEHFLFDIFNDLLKTESYGENEISSIMKKKLFHFYEYLINKMLTVNCVKYPNLFKEMSIFINQKLNNGTDVKPIFEALIYFLYTRKNDKAIASLNQMYIYNMFNKALFKIHVDEYTKIIIISKLNDILKTLFEQLYFVIGNERRNSYSSALPDEGPSDDAEEDIRGRDDMLINNATSKEPISGTTKKKRTFLSEMDMINDEYRKYCERMDRLSKGPFSDELIVNPHNHNVPLDVDNPSYKDLAYLSDADSVDLYCNLGDDNDRDNNSECAEQQSVDETTKWSATQIAHIKSTNKLKDLNSIFLLDLNPLNTIVKCISSVLLNFPLFTKKQLIELFRILFLKNKHYILINEKNVLQNNLYNLNKENKMKHIGKVMMNPLKKLNMYHLFFIFSNNHLELCLKHLMRYFKKNFLHLANRGKKTYRYNESVVLNNALFVYQHLVIFQNSLATSNKGSFDLGLKLLFCIIKAHINNCVNYVTTLVRKWGDKIGKNNGGDFFTYYSGHSDADSAISELTVDLRIEEENIVKSLVYTSTKMKLSSLGNLFDKLLVLFEQPNFESNPNCLLDNYKTVYERRIYFLYFYRLYQNFGSVLSEKNKYLFDLLNNIKFVLLACHRNCCQSDSSSTGGVITEDAANPVCEATHEKEDFKEDPNYNIEYTTITEGTKRRKVKKGAIRSTWYWFDLGYCTLLCLYEILKNEKKNQKNFTPIYYQTCFDYVINCFDIFAYLPRLHANDNFKNCINEDVIRYSEHLDNKMVSIALFDILKLILFELYSLYINDPEKIQIMTMRLSLKNENNNTSSNVTLCIILTLKYIYDTIGYKELLFAVTDLYQLFSELNDHPDDEIEFVTKEWFASISKFSAEA